LGPFSIFPPKIPPDVTAQSPNGVTSEDTDPKPVEVEKDKTLPGGKATGEREPIDGTTICSMCASWKKKKAPHLRLLRVLQIQSPLNSLQG
jgi:hypothetical protein